MKKVTSKDGTSIAYDVSGTGEPLILVDGALCGRLFGPMPKLAALLAPHFTVINYDRRGRGDSSDTRPYAVEREVEDIEALITAVGGAAYLCGISSGAVLAFEAAAKGLNIKKLALYEPPYMADNETGHKAPADSLKQLQTMVAEERRGDAVKFFLKDMVGVPAMVVFIMKLLPVFKKLKAVAHTLPYDAAIIGDQSIPVAKAAGIKVPTQVMNGTKTGAQLQRAAEALSKVIPQAGYVTLKGQTHNVSEKVFAPALVEYFKAK